MQQNLITNILLTVIAAFLLVLVIQNASGPKIVPGAMMTQSSRSAAPVPPHSAPSNPAPPVASSQDFNPAEMVYAALRCPNDPTLTLAEPGCQSTEATSRRNFVDESFSKGLPIRQVFDSIVGEFGENALTDEAIEIRKANRRG